MAINSEAATTREEEVAPPEAWDAIAAGYDEFVAPGEAPFANAGLRLAGLNPGERFLDVAAGPGGLSLPAARLGAKVLATDWSPAMNLEQIGRDGSDESSDQGVDHPADQFSLAAGEGVEGAVSQNDGRADSTRFVGVSAEDRPRAAPRPAAGRDGTWLGAWRCRLPGRRDRGSPVRAESSR